MALPQKTPPVLDEAILQRIIEIGEKRLPTEACGVAIPTPWRGERVFEMPNRSKTPRDSFEFQGSDVMITLEQWLAQNEELWGEFIVWHTHPGGNIGPSEKDIEVRVEDVHNLVVALTPEGPVPCWF